MGQDLFPLENPFHSQLVVHFLTAPEGYTSARRDLYSRFSMIGVQGQNVSAGMCFAVCGDDIAICIGEEDLIVGCLLDTEPAFMHQPVMVAAEQHQVIH